MQMMHYDAVNVADGELSLGSSFFQQLVAAEPIPVISANLATIQPNDKPALIKPYVIRNFGSLRVGVIGVAQRSYFADAQIEEPGLPP